MRNTFGTRRGLNDTTAYEYGKHIKTVWKSPPFLAFFEQTLCERPFPSAKMKYRKALC